MFTYNMNLIDALVETCAALHNSSAFKNGDLMLLIQGLGYRLSSLSTTY